MSFGLVTIRDGEFDKIRRNFQRINSVLFGPGATPTFSSLTLTGLTLSGLTASRLVSTDANKALASVTNLAAWIAGMADEIDVANDGDGTITIGIVNPLIVGKGGTGAATLTDHGILLGSGTSAVTALGAATNGQLPIGSTGADPVLATITGTANQVISTPGAGSITLSTPQDIHTGAGPTFADLTLSAPSSVYALSHDSFADFVAGEHFLQTAITNVSTGLATGVLKVTTGTGALSSVAGISGSLVLDDGVTERITLVFTDGVLTSRTVGATVGLLIDWTD